MHFNVIAQFCVIFFVLRQLRLVFLNFKFFGKLEGWKLSFTKQPVWKSYCGYKLNRSPGTRLEWRVWQRKMWANKKTTCDETTCLKFERVSFCMSVIHQQLNYLCHVLSPPKQVSNVIKKWPAKWDHEDSMAKADCMPRSIWNCACLRPTHEGYIMQYCHVTIFFSSETRSTLTHGACWVSG